MPSLRLTLTVIAGWLAAGLVAAMLFAAIGPGWSWGLCCALLALAASSATILAGLRHDRAHYRALASVALASGLAEQPGEDLSLQAIVARLERRLEKAHQFKSAVAVMNQRVLVVDDVGQIRVASAGVKALAPDAVEGGTLDALFGKGYLDTGGGAPETGMVMLGTTRFDVSRRQIGTKLYLLELVPAGSYVEDDDLDAYASAMAEGQTGFRFEADVASGNRALAALNTGLDAINIGVAQLDRVLAGTFDDAGGVGALARQARQLAEFIAAAEAQLADEAAAREALEHKLSAIGGLVAGFEARASAMGTIATEVAADAGTTSKALLAGNTRLRQARTIGRHAENLAGEADLAAQRTHSVVTAIDRMTADIDRMVASIEEVSFRTNLLALNAAVEAARAGEKGAGFAVVADEVRQLAQITNRSAKEIRALVSAGRSQSEAGVSQAQTLQKMLGDLTAHLRNLSNETDTIASTLSDGEVALLRLAGRMDRFGDAAGVAGQAPRRASA